MEALLANGHNGAPRHNRRGVTEVRADSTSGPTLMRYFMAMSQALGPMQWWPAKTPFEVCVGAILVQNTSWTNVERAIANLKSADVLEPAKLFALSQVQLAQLIRPAGYFNVKAQRLRSFLRVLVVAFDCDLQKLFAGETAAVRE